MCVCYEHTHIRRLLVSIVLLIDSDAAGMCDPPAHTNTLTHRPTRSHFLISNLSLEGRTACVQCKVGATPMEKIMASSFFSVDVHACMWVGGRTRKMANMLRITVRS